MFVRQVKRKCNVRGCKNTDCFAISRTREIGNTVIACKSCLGEAIGAINEIDPKTKSNIPSVSKTGAPSLFFNAKALGKIEAKDGLTADIVTVDENPMLTPENGQENNTPLAEDGNKEPEPGSVNSPVDGVTIPPVDGDGKEPEQLDGVDPADDTTDAEDSTGDVPPADATEFKCPICGRSFYSEKGLKTHLRYCKPQNDKD